MKMAKLKEILKYLNYNSFHPTHCKDNIPFNFAKRIIVFVTNSDKNGIKTKRT